jgi:hypothetical protein
MMLAHSSITSDNVPPCTQSGLDMSTNPRKWVPTTADDKAILSDIVVTPLQGHQLQSDNVPPRTQSATDMSAYNLGLTTTVERTSSI